MLNPPTRARLIAAALAAATVPLGFGLKASGSRFLSNMLAGSVYEVFFCLLAFAVFPTRRAALRIALSVFLATSLLEFLQLVDHPLLASARSTFIGRAFLGSTFSWVDFPFYAFGSMVGLGLMAAIAPRPAYTPGRPSGDHHAE